MPILDVSGPWAPALRRHPDLGLLSIGEGDASERRPGLLLHLSVLQQCDGLPLADDFRH